MRQPFVPSHFGTLTDFSGRLENSLKTDSFMAQGKGPSRLPRPEGAFDEICRRFHVHIKPSVSQVGNVHVSDFAKARSKIQRRQLTPPKQLLIWGKTDQVAEAQSIILGLINKCDEDLAAWRNQYWKRVENDRPQEEEYEQVQKEHESMLKELRKEPKESDIRSRVRNAPTVTDLNLDYINGGHDSCFSNGPQRAQ